MRLKQYTHQTAPNLPTYQVPTKEQTMHYQPQPLHQKAQATQAVPNPNDIIWRNQIAGMLNVQTCTISGMIKSGKIPPPDVYITNKTKGWRRSTLTVAGVL